MVKKEKPLGLCTRKLNLTQKNYTVRERELLSIVEALKIFKGILHNQDFIVHTDHQNLLYAKYPSQRMTR